MTLKLLTLFFILSSFFCSYSQNNEIDSLINELHNSQENISKVDLYNQIAEKFQLLANYEFSNKYAELGIILSKKINYNKGTIKGYNYIGVNAMRTGNYSEAIKSQNKALALAKATEDLKEISFSLNNLGSVARMQGNYDDALEYHYDALKLADKINNLELIASIYGNIGSVLYFLNDFEETIKYYSLALEICNELKDYSRTMILYINIGNVYLIKGDLDTGLEYYLEAIEINKKVDNKNFLADNYNNIGLIYEAQEKYEKAIEMFEKSLLIKEELNDKTGITNAYKNLGLTNIRLKNHEEARIYIYKGIEIAKEIGSKYLIAGLYKDLYSLDTLTEDFKSALLNFTTYSLYMDSMLNEANNEKISELKIKYETLQKDNEIEMQKNAIEKNRIEINNQKMLNTQQLQEILILNKDKQLQRLELEFKEEELLRKQLELKDKKNKIEIVVLENELKKKEIDQQKFTKKVMTYSYISTFLFLVFFGAFIFRKRTQDHKHKLVNLELNALKAQIKPHFIFNALNSISNLIHRNEKDKANELLVKFSKLMRTILRNSLTENVSLSDEISSLKRYLDIEKESLKDKFTYSIQVDPAIDQENTQIGSLLLQPFIENAIWHGISPKEGNGHINLEIFKKKNHLFCIIEDNGVGRKSSNLSKDGSLIENQSLGIKITQKRIELLSKNKCKLNFIDLSNGLRVEISIPFNEMF